MKKFVYIANKILLIINVLLLFLFSAEVIFGYEAYKNPLLVDLPSLLLIITLFYEFAFLFFSAIMSKIIKVDLSYKGTDAFSLVSRKFTIIIVTIGIILIAYALITKIQIEFIVMIITMIFSITLESGITKLFKRHL